MRKLLSSLALLLLLALPTLSQNSGPGLFLRPGPSSINAPVTNSTFLFNTSNGQVYVWNGSQFQVLTLPPSNLTASTNPGSTNDNTQGFAPGSFWINNALHVVYVCANAVTGAAAWNVIGTITPPNTSNLPLVSDTTQPLGAAYKLLPLVGIDATSVPSGNVIVCNGTQWVSELLPLASLQQGGATTGQVLAWNGTAYAPSSAGSGTLSSFSANTLAPLFTTSVATSTTTPVLSFALSNAAAQTWFGNAAGTSGAPSFNGTPVPVPIGGTGLGTPPNAGQLLIGNGTLGTYVLGTLTAGPNVNITNADGSITIGVPSAGGSVSNFSANNLPALFTTSVSNPTTTPVLNFIAANAPPNSWFGNSTGLSAAPTFNLSALPPLSGGTGSGVSPTNGQIPIGSTSSGFYAPANITAGSNITVTNSPGGIQISATGGGLGSVTNFSANTLSPLFTTSVATSTTTPVLSFAMSNAPAHQFFGNNTGTGAPGNYVSIGAGDLPAQAVTSVSGLSPLFTASIASQALGFSLTGQASGTILGNWSGSAGAPIYNPEGTNDQLLGVVHAGSGLEYKTITAGTNVTITPSAGAIIISATGGGGSGTVTSVGSNTLSPLFTTSVANSTTTPVISYALSSAGAGTLFGNFTGSSGAPSYNAPGSADQLVGAAHSGGGLEYKTITAGSGITVTPTTGAITIAATGGGSGTVTNFSANTLSPLFTTSVATATSTPVLSFALSNASAGNIFANFGASSGAPSFNAPGANDQLLGVDHSDSGLEYKTITAGSGITVTPSAGAITIASTSSGGSVTSFSSGNLSPLFSTSVATATSTPAQSFSLTNAGAGTLFGNFSGSSGAPSYNAPGTADQIVGVAHTGGGVEYKTIAAGSGVTVTPTAGTITIAATGGGGGIPTTADVLTVTNDTGSLPNSYQLIGTQASGALALASSASAGANRDTVVGFNASSGTGGDNTLYGWGATVNSGADICVLMGRSAQVSNNAEVVVGYNSQATGSAGTVLGSNASQSGSNSIALGAGSTDSGHSNVCSIGSNGGTRDLIWVKHIIGGDTGATIAAGSGGDATATVAVTGSDLAGNVSVTAAGTPAASAVICTVTFNDAYTNAPYVTFSPNNAAAGALTGIYVTSTTTGFSLNAGTVPLVAGTTYTWNFITASK